MGTLLALLVWAAAAAAPLPPGARETKTMAHGGLTRTWHLFKPEQGAYPRPVLFAFLKRHPRPEAK